MGLIPNGFLCIFFKKYILDVRVFSGGFRIQTMFQVHIPYILVGYDILFQHRGYIGF